MATGTSAEERRAAGAADALARWATSLEPSEEDLALAQRSLLDTVAVMWAGRRHPLCRVFGRLSETGRLAALAHVLDYDDLHVPSTTHISAVCVPVALSCGGDARAYLAGAGVMARLGAALGWRHYEAGWHATCTAGAFGAAVTAAVARGLDAERVGRGDGARGARRGRRAAGVRDLRQVAPGRFCRRGRGARGGAGPGRSERRRARARGLDGSGRRGSLVAP